MQLLEKVMITEQRSIILMSEVKAEPVGWLWPLRIPMGELTIIDGDPGTNKSSFTLDVAARVSTGREMPDGTKGKAGGVLLMTAEDSLTKTLPHRLRAAGANMERIAVFGKTLTIPYDLDEIETAARQVKARLMILDPFVFFLGGNANGEQSVRQGLIPLKQLAERMNMAVLLVRHLNKSGKQSLYRGTGSIGIIATTRSGLLIAKDPQDADMRVLCHYKSNLGPLTPSLLFEPVPVDDSLAIEWRGESEYTADDLLGQSKGGGEKLHAAKELLHELLASGPMREAEVKNRIAGSGISSRTVERAKQMMSVVSRRKGFGPGSHIVWALPDVDDEQPAEESHRPPNPQWRSMEKPVLKLVKPEREE